jgi:hypothetical protein
MNREEADPPSLLLASPQPAAGFAFAIALQKISDQMLLAGGRHAPTIKE